VGDVRDVPAAGWVCHTLSVRLHWPHGPVRQPVYRTDSGAGEPTALLAQQATLKATCQPHSNRDQAQPSTRAGHVPHLCLYSARSAGISIDVQSSASACGQQRSSVFLWGCQGIRACAVLCCAAPVSRADGCCESCAGSGARDGQGVSHKCGVHGHWRYGCMASLQP
jgi:hypothetical protein